MQELGLRVPLPNFIPKHDDERSELSCKQDPRIHGASSTELPESRALMSHFTGRNSC